jgi:hypothetical protein
MLLYIRTSTYDSGMHDERVYNIKVWQLILQVIILFIPFISIIVNIFLLSDVQIDYKYNSQYYFKNNSKLVTKIYNFLNKEMWKQKQ